MKRYPQPELHFDGKELKTDLGEGNTIFVGSSCDMWADAINGCWISTILDHCWAYPDNNYLFQSKNPSRFPMFEHWKEIRHFILGTTIETNRTYSHEVYKAPYRRDRYLAMTSIKSPKIVSIEPIMDFDNDILVQWISDIEPTFVSIGADSGRNGLPEPSPDKVVALIEALKGITEVKIKDNLSRLLAKD